MSGKIHRIQRAKAAERIVLDQLVAMRAGIALPLRSIEAAALEAGYTAADLDAHEARRLAQQEPQPVPGQYEAGSMSPGYQAEMAAKARGE